ncbi:hypothetical protein FHS45_000251 [Thalassobacillus devorans]|uniref:hypothetical protein n=1 Tax=Thalassobacillus devorans TaxID=279813 RepID=UPI00078353F2|nr:hypothetical protein [Thalassobacillus devorans]NIK27160.1 hypothetical protein [Thalassobacillus devorans]
MNHYLEKLLIDKIVESLPGDKRELYKYVIQMEDEIAAVTATRKEYISYLSINSPHKKAANHFDITLLELLNRMKEIEEEVGKKLIDCMESIEWRDCTDIVHQHLEYEERKKYFLVAIP